MKRDLNLCLSILEAVEKIDRGFIKADDFNDIDKYKFLYHFTIMNEANLLMVDSNWGHYLTMAGHDYLEKLRNEPTKNS